MSDTRPGTPVVLAEVTRGDAVESRHWGQVVVMHGDGSLVASLGDPEVVTFFRSSAKPFQALPLLTSGAADAFGLTPKELAVVCGSHGGEAIHLEAVLSILNKLGLTADALQCGPHEPYDPRAKQQLHAQRQAPSVLHNNCSGKHAGMLALAKYLEANTGTYLQSDHPVQRAILKALSTFSGMNPEDIPSGVDGCGVPTYALSLQTMARMYARLSTRPETLDVEVRQACQRLVAAMTTHPEMVEGTAEGESLDSALMMVTEGRLVSKVGAEGVYTAGVLPCEVWPTGLGDAMKVEDGDGTGRARSPIVIELFRQLKILGEDEITELKAYTAPEVKNHRGETVGEVRTVFDITDYA